VLLSVLVPELFWLVYHVLGVALLLVVPLLAVAVVERAMLGLAQALWMFLSRQEP
jgi:hypothetical protein